MGTVLAESAPFDLTRSASAWLPAAFTEGRIGARSITSAAFVVRLDSAQRLKRERRGESDDENWYLAPNGGHHSLHGHGAGSTHRRHGAEHPFRDRHHSELSRAARGHSQVRPR